MLTSGAHVSIDGIEYTLAKDPDGKLQIRESFETLFANTSAIAGELAAQQIRPNRIYWSITDWSGGEGAVVYYPQNPAQYDQGSLVNVTKRGQLTTRTKRRRAAVARAGSNADTGKRPAGVSAYTYALISWEDNIIESTDCGASDAWVAAQDITPGLADVDFADAVSDGISAAFLQGTDASGTGVIPAVSPITSASTWSDVDSGTTVNDPKVACVLNGVPYTFAESAGSGDFKIWKKAARLGTAGEWAGTQVFNPGVNFDTTTGTWGTDYWTAAAAAETSAFFSFSTKSHGFVWEVRDDVGRPFWTAPAGFAIKELIYHMGILFAIGNQHAAGNSFATLWAIPLQTQTPLIVAEPRRHQNTTLSTFSKACADNGPGLFLADENSGKIFYYDIQRDALSLFDDLANGGTGDGVDFVADTDKIAFLAMHGARMFLATWEPGGAGTSLQVISYDDLEVQNRDSSQAISANVETAAWDMGLPMETKALMGFHVIYKVTDSGTTSGLVANSRITISYSMDDASYSTTVASGASATITSATTPSSGIKGRHFIQVSDGTTTQKFTRMKVKITLDNNSQAVAPPIVFSVVAETRPMAFERTWDLIIQAEDEESNERPTSRQHTGQYIRDQLATLATQKEVVTFIDGSWSKIPNDTDSYTVVVEDPTPELADQAGNGQVAIRLRSIV